MQLALELDKDSVQAVAVAGGCTMDILAENIAKTAIARQIALCPTAIVACQTMFATIATRLVPPVVTLAQAVVQAASQALFFKVGDGLCGLFYKLRGPLASMHDESLTIGFSVF